ACLLMTILSPSMSERSYTTSGVNENRNVGCAICGGDGSSIVIMSRHVLLASCTVVRMSFTVPPAASASCTAATTAIAAIPDAAQPQLRKLIATPPPARLRADDAPFVPQPSRRPQPGLRRHVPARSGETGEGRP